MDCRSKHNELYTVQCTNKMLLIVIIFMNLYYLHSWSFILWVKSIFEGYARTQCNRIHSELYVATLRPSSCSSSAITHGQQYLGSLAYAVFKGHLLKWGLIMKRLMFRNKGLTAWVSPKVNLMRYNTQVALH